MEVFFDLMVLGILVLIIIAVLFVIVSGYFHQRQEKIDAERERFAQAIKGPLYDYYLFGKIFPGDYTFDTPLKLNVFLEINESIIKNFDDQTLMRRMAHFTQKIAGDYIYALATSSKQNKRNQGLRLIRNFHLKDLYQQFKKDGHLENKNLSPVYKLVLMSEFEPQIFVREFLRQSSLISVQEKNDLFEQVSSPALDLLIESFPSLTKANKISLIKATGNRVDRPPLDFLVRVIQEGDLDMKYYGIKSLDKFISVDHVADVIETSYILGLQTEESLRKPDSFLELKGEN